MQYDPEMRPDFDDILEIFDANMTMNQINELSIANDSNSVSEINGAKLTNESNVNCNEVVDGVNGFSINKQENGGDIFDQHLIRRRNSLITSTASFVANEISTDVSRRKSMSPTCCKK